MNRRGLFGALAAGLATILGVRDSGWGGAMVRIERRFAEHNARLDSLHASALRYQPESWRGPVLLEHARCSVRVESDGSIVARGSDDRVCIISGGRIMTSACGTTWTEVT